MLDQALSAAPGPATPQYEAPILIKRNQQYTRLSLDEAIHRELGYLQGETHKTGKEYMTLMAQGGNRLLGTWSSGKTRTKIFLSDDIRHILENHGEGTLCLLHSHPNNTIFSVGDLAIMNHYESIGNMKLVLSNGKKYSLAIEDGKRLHDEDFAELVEFMDEINDPDKNLFNADKLRRIKEKYNWS